MSEHDKKQEERLMEYLKHYKEYGKFPEPEYMSDIFLRVIAKVLIEEREEEVTQ